jgi:hypothetical protein
MGGRHSAQGCLVISLHKKKKVGADVLIVIHIGTRRADTPAIQKEKILWKDTV